jgi:excisionase family DNA binding protein
MPEDLSLGEAAKQLGVSVDTLRRWDASGKLETTRDESDRRRVAVSEVERLREKPERHRTGDTFSAREVRLVATGVELWR